MAEAQIKRVVIVGGGMAGKTEYFRGFGQLSLKSGERLGEFSGLRVVLGQGVVPSTALRLTAGAHPERLKAFMADLDGIYGRAVAGLSTHAAYVERHCRADA